MPIDYERMQRMHPKLKAALTRATNKPAEQRYDAVKAACVAAVTEWNQIGAWPDNWSLWQRTLHDAAMAHRPGQKPIIYLEDLV